jgi:hypothetical protein
VNRPALLSSASAPVASGHLIKHGRVFDDAASPERAQFSGALDRIPLELRRDDDVANAGVSGWRVFP